MTAKFRRNGSFMPHAYAQNLIHLVFSTKHRRPQISVKRQKQLWEYIVGIGVNHKIMVVAVGGMEDHIHLLFGLPATMTLAKAVQVLKANSSRWMNEHDSAFSWQEGYGAFGVSASNKKAVIEYIQTQSEHHRNRTFEEEFVFLLKKHEVDYDPEWVFG